MAKYSSVQRYQDREVSPWTSHIQTNDLDEARREAEIDHEDHPEHGHGVLNWETKTLVFQLIAVSGSKV